MILHLPKLWSRVAAILLATVPLILFFFAVAQPILDRYAQIVSDLQVNKDLLNRISIGLEDQEELRRRLARLQTLAEGNRAYIRSETEALAEAKLIERLNEIARAHGVLLRSTQSLNAGDYGGSQRVSLRVSFSTDFKRLVDLIYDLESSHPFLFVDDIDIRSPIRSADSEAANRTSSQPLSVRMDVFGLLIPGGIG